MPKQTMVDWDAAATLTGKITPAGPRLGADEAAEVVSGLRAAAAAAVEPILETTRMRPAPGLAQDSFGDVLVVDRAGWAATNLMMMKQVAEPAMAAVAEALPSNPVTPYGAAAEVAAMMGVMAPRVLGQFDPYTAIGALPSAPTPPNQFYQTGEGPEVADAAYDSGSKPRQFESQETPRRLSAGGVSAAQNPLRGVDAALPNGPQHDNGDTRGQLLLIAPNVAQVERKLDVNHDEFRLWVALHEQTHGLQFAAAPWLAPYLYELLGCMMSAMTDKTLEAAQGNLWQKFLSTLKLARDLFNSMVHTDGPGPIEALLGPAQQAAFDTISATMALLEGHADVMMDEVGPAVVPTVGEIREKFEKRRDGEGQAQAGVMLRRLMGMDAKLAQYRDGAVFVRGVESVIGRDGFNAIWAGPENLPTPEEIKEPTLWVTRVHG